VPLGPWGRTVEELPDPQGIGDVVASLPNFPRIFFKHAKTWSEATLVRNGVEFKVHELPQWHPYFEHLIVGFIAEVLELRCANPIQLIRLRGGAGKSYQYLLQPARPKRNGRVDPTPSVEEGSRHLSNRQTEVLW
jgi:hypothetical protein